MEFPSLPNLPTEIKLRILRYLLKGYPGIALAIHPLMHAYTPKTYTEILRVRNEEYKRSPFLDTAILSVCRSLYHTGLTVLYGENPIRVTIPFRIDVSFEIFQKHKHLMTRLQLSINFDGSTTAHREQILQAVGEGLRSLRWLIIWFNDCMSSLHMLEEIEQAICQHSKDKGVSLGLHQGSQYRITEASVLFYYDWICYKSLDRVLVDSAHDASSDKGILSCLKESIIYVKLSKHI